MGNSSSREERKASRPSSLRNHGNTAQVPSAESSPSYTSPAERLAVNIYAQRNGSARESRRDLFSLSLGGRGERQHETAQSERPKETKQEREARRVERERQARLKERERSLREEHVDGGYLVTLGTYSGPEDFSKPVVRQLQIERRLAPFWKGLDDHSDSWTEAQLVAAARGLPIPKPDEVPPETPRTASRASNARAADTNINCLTVPIGSRSQSYQSDRSTHLVATHPTPSNSGPSSPTSLTSATNAQLLRGRAKTLAATVTGRNQSSDMIPQEIRLPNDPNVNGQPLEAYLYKDATECPICFLYYPPYLNKTRCCNQAICSECFVQIKRPDPHPPEHEQPGEQRSPEEEAEMLVSEVAACPYCVMPEFGVTYDPPPFKRGLAYPQSQSTPFRDPTSADTSSTSLAPPAGRRRTTSLSANDSRVITTDRVRPDWKKKLDDARAHALRRSAAATALHNAAYVIGNNGDSVARGFMGRRRRTLFGESPNASRSGTPREGMSPAEYDAYFRPSNRSGQGEGNDLVSGRTSSRRNRVDDLEDLMMMEAIRLSLQAEEERKRKEEKEAQKEAKKKAKADKKEEKKQGKAARKSGGGSLYNVGTNESSSTWASTSMARSSSNLGNHAAIPEEQVQGKGKQPAQDFAGFNPLSEPTSTLNRARSPSPATSTVQMADPQRHLEESRANLQPPASAPIVTTSNPRASNLRQLSNASSTSSSFIESTTPGSLQAGGAHLDVTAGAPRDQTDISNFSSTTGTPAATAASAEPMFNFRSLAAMVDKEEGNDHIEHAEPETGDELKEPSPTASPRLSPSRALDETNGNRSRGDSGESSSSAPPPIYEEHADDGIQQTEQMGIARHDGDHKEIGSIDVHPRDAVQADD